jgi:hypothetical protein
VLSVLNVLKGIVKGARVAKVPGSNCFAYPLQLGGQLVAHPIFGFAFRLLPPERRLDQTQTSGGVGRALFEHVAA